MDPALIALDFAKAGAVVADMIVSYLAAGAPPLDPEAPNDPNAKIADRHLSKQACIYIRQSTPAQVRFNQESTDRQYHLADKALSLGWNQNQIRVLDRDLGQTGTAATTRTDFKTLVL